MKYIRVYIGLTVLAVLLIWILNACTKRKPDFKPQDPRVELQPAFRTFRHEAGWGFDIYIGDSLLVHQENIPALETERGFEKEKHAERTAVLMIQKLASNNGDLPVVTEAELDSLGIRLN